MKKDAITYAHDAGFFSFNVIGWKAEFERLIEAVRADALAELATVNDSLTVQDHIRDVTKMVKRPQNCGTGFCSCIECVVKPDHIADAGNKVPDHITDAGKVILTIEQAQQIEEALAFAASHSEYLADDLILYGEALATIRTARAQEQAGQEPVVRATLAPPAPPEVYQMRSKDAYEAGWWEAQRQKAVSPIAPAQQAEQEPFDMNDHPPHRLCECRKCMEYFTPLPDCDAFAASGKPIAEQTNTQFMEGYRIGLAEMREKCAKVVTEHAPTCSPHWVSYVVAIRAIKFEGDTGFRPVSEMIAEHKQDPKTAAAIEKAKMRKAEQEPVAFMFKVKRTTKARTVLDEFAAIEYFPQANEEIISKEPLIYAAPVDAKAIRTEALEDAVKFLEENGMIAPNGFTAAGIRGLK